MTTSNQTLKKIKIIGQITLSAIVLAGGIYLCASCPDLRSWGAGIIGMIIGYWLR